LLKFLASLLNVLVKTYNICLTRGAISFAYYDRSKWILNRAIAWTEAPTIDKHYKVNSNNYIDDLSSLKEWTVGFLAVSKVLQIPLF